MPELHSNEAADDAADDALDKKVPIRHDQEPPRRLLGILQRLGPGLIIAGSIVGSGELIGTTKTGAVAGFALLWLIILGCFIKVFTQVEIGRYTIVNAKTSMEGFNEVPGPRLVVNWMLWYWFVMFFVSMGQLGGIVGGVGQALAITMPLSAQGASYTELSELRVRLHTALTTSKSPRVELAERTESAEQAAKLTPQLERKEAEYRQSYPPRVTTQSGRTVSVESRPHDEFYWAAIVTLFTMFLLVYGRYRLIENFSTCLVAGFTLVTIINVLVLQGYARWAISWEDIAQGFEFSLPPTLGPGLDGDPIFIALATFGIIGVGANELISYPYWCLEKGYARFTGPRDKTPEWANRAQGWLRVMQWDAWCSMVVYTLATIAFYFLGAAVLNRQGLNPPDATLIMTLSEMYLPVFGAWAKVLFLFGAFAVLYSTFFVASAGHARVATDAARIFGLPGWQSEAGRKFGVRFFSALFPLLSFLLYCFFQTPTILVLASGAMQAIMLPMLGVAGLFFRYRRGDDRLSNNLVWDFCHWLAVVILFISAGALVCSIGTKILNSFTAG